MKFSQHSFAARLSGSCQCGPTCVSSPHKLWRRRRATPPPPPSARARSSVALGELLTAGEEPRPPGPLKQAEERGAARRQRQAFKRDSRASAGGQVDTWHRQTANRRQVNPARAEVFPGVKSASPSLCSPSVSASSAQVAACYRKTCFQNKSEGYRLACKWIAIRISDMSNRCTLTFKANLNSCIIWLNVVALYPCAASGLICQNNDQYRIFFLLMVTWNTNFRVKIRKCL